MEKAELEVEKGQTTTDARAREFTDFRNMISMAAANHAFAKDLPKDLIGNFDSTRFELSDENTEPLVRLKDREPLPLTLKESFSLPQGVKWFMLCNANGNLGPDVFLISNPSFEKENFAAYEIKGLTHTNDIRLTGFLCATKSSVGNEEFFTWYLQHIVTPFTEDCRDRCSKEDRDTQFYLVADGEEFQIKPIEKIKCANS